MIKLTKNWVNADHSIAKGYLHDEEGGFYEDKTLSFYFANITDEVGFIEAVKKANGCFAVVVQTDRAILAAVDKIRSIPLFYDFKGNVADKAEALYPLVAEMLKDNEAFTEYLMTGFVRGNETLHPEIKQIPAGHYLLIEEGKEPILKEYYAYLGRKEEKLKEDELIEEMHQMHLHLVERLIRSLNGRSAVIPLSGGYDSRLLAYLLKKLKYPSIYTFSYEAKGNRESELSKQVAEALELPWYFLEHSHESWYKAYFSEERKAHYRYAFNGVSSPHIQDWDAVRGLKKQKLIPQDSVFIPGHSADFLQGGHLPKEYANKASFGVEELLGQILAKHYRLWQGKAGAYTELFKRRIIQSLPKLDKEMEAAKAAELFEYWDLQERQAKFIVNSIRVYEDLGFSWRLPFWDNEMLSFWAKVPLQYRLKRGLWESYAKRYLPLDIPVFRDYPIKQRIINKLWRIFYGEVWDVRYGRFAKYGSLREYSSIRVESYLREDIQYPEFVDRKRPLMRCDINGLQALRAIFELGDKAEIEH